jgi:hypothetical protein
MNTNATTMHDNQNDNDRHAPPSRTAARLLRKVLALSSDEQIFIVDGVLAAHPISGDGVGDEPGAGEMMAAMELVQALDGTPGGRVALSAQLRRMGRALERAATELPGASAAEIWRRADEALLAEDCAAAGPAC